MKINLNDTLGKVVCFLVLCAFVLAFIGGTAYLFHDGHHLFGWVNLILSIMASPMAVLAFLYLTDNYDSLT